MPAADYPRPAKLYLYGARTDLQRTLTLGEFHLQPAQIDLSPADLPFRRKPGAATANAGFLTLRFNQVWDERLFDAVPSADGCLVIHDAESFGERIHRAAQRLLPNWSGIDAPISYGKPSSLGMLFSKPEQSASEQEWLFAWRPIQPTQNVHGLSVGIGSIEAIAEVRGKSH